MYSIKNVVERVGDARHEYGAVRFLMSSMRYHFLAAFKCRLSVCMHSLRAITTDVPL